MNKNNPHSCILDKISEYKNDTLEYFLLKEEYTKKLKEYESLLEGVENNDEGIVYTTTIDNVKFGITESINACKNNILYYENKINKNISLMKDIRMALFSMDAVESSINQFKKGFTSSMFAYKMEDFRTVYDPPVQLGSFDGITYLEDYEPNELIKKDMINGIYKYGSNDERMYQYGNNKERYRRCSNKNSTTNI